MPIYTSPDAGEVDAPDGYTAAAWLMHRHAHALYGERAIVRQRMVWPIDLAADSWHAAAWIGAPVPGDGRLDYAAITVYSLDAYLLQSSYLTANTAGLVATAGAEEITPTEQ